MRRATTKFSTITLPSLEGEEYIYTEIAEKAEDIDVARAEAAKHRAEERLARPVVEIDAERARIALIRAIARLQVSSRQNRPRP